MGKLSKFEKMMRKAAKNNWSIPRTDHFSDESWMRYWQGMVEYKQDSSKGRPVPPHRTGGAILPQ